jgi:hypothetical protein
MKGPFFYSVPEKPKKFQMKSSLQKSVRLADRGWRGLESDDLF